ncbi:MAG: DUF421 domain-containing protein [Christensenellales bacterium]
MILKLLIFSLISVVYLFIISKLLGKKQIAQLEFIDYVLGISIGSIAAEMATDIDETPFYYYLIAITVFFLFDLFVTYIGRKSPTLKRFFKGKPTVIIYDGKFNYKNLKSSKLDVNDVLGLCRQLGYFDISKIAYAVFETSGELSVLPIGEEKPTVIKDLKVEGEQASLPNHLIIDGYLSYSGLNEINKSKQWLFERLNINSKQDLQNIVLATYDSEKDSFNVHYKQKND